MALTPCRECQQEVSDQAQRCPSCGTNLPYLSAEDYQRTHKIATGILGTAFFTTIGCLPTLFAIVMLLALLAYAWPLALIGAVIWAIVYFVKKSKAG